MLATMHPILIGVIALVILGVIIELCKIFKEVIAAIFVVSMTVGICWLVGKFVLLFVR